MIESKGQYPLYDVSMRITDQNVSRAIFDEYHRTMEGKPFPAEVDQKLSVRNITVGNISPSNVIMGAPGMRWPTAGLDARGFLVEINARNGYMREVPAEC